MACKYTYGGQEYDSLDDLKAAVKNDLQRSADKENVQSRNTGKGNFLGYVRSENGVPFSSAGKGKPEGDGKDKAMRKVANAGFIGELSLDGTQGSSTLTSFFGSSTGDPSVNMDNKNPLQARIYDGSSTNYSIYNVSEIPDSNYPVILVRNNGSNASMFGWTRGVVMLARNGKLSGKPLKDKTKKEILDAHNVGARFVVGDMPGVDTQFIDYLNEIGATYKVYTTNSEGTEFDRSGSSGQSYRNMLKSNIVDNINQSNTAESIYSKLGKKTQSNSVDISNIKTAEGTYNRVANIKEAQDNDRIYSMETTSDLSYSNPWASFDRKGTIRTTSTSEAVKNYIDWLTTDKFKDVKPERREWILSKLKSGELKGKRIQYYAELKEPSHATALDYLINKYDWNATSQQSNTTQQPKTVGIERNFVELENDILDFESKVQELFNAPTIELYEEVVGNYEYDLSANIDNSLRKDIESKLRDVKKSFTVTKSQQKITDAEVQAMTKALVEMYPEIEFGIENNPNFVDREGVFNQRIENEMDRDYWRDLYRNTYTKNQQEFRLMSIPTIADKYEPDTEHVYHGTKNYKIDSEGNLILVPSENYSGKTTSISFTQIPVVAQDYMIRKRGNIIIKIDNDVLGDDYEVESAEEIAVNGNKLFIVPKGKYTIITVPRLNELREVEVGKQIDKKANKLLSTISDDLALLDTIYAAQIEAKNYSEFQEQTDNPNKIVDSLYLDERYVASAAGTQIYEQVASKVDKQWIITALSNKLIDDIENTGKTISNIEDALWDMSRYGEDYAPHTSNLFEELLNHIGLGYNAAFGVSENATKESILLQQEKQKEREEIVDKIEELVNKADEKALAVYNSEEEVAKRKERKLLRDTARAKYLSLAENQVKQEMPDDLPFQKIQKDGKSKIIGQADIQARKVLIDAAFKNKPDLVSHEFAHHYIAWFRNTPLVQQGIKMYGSEEELVEAIGKQAVVQRGKAWSWWKKFVAWLLNSANDVSDLTKENLRDILTDAFLSRQDLNKQAGTEAGVKLEKNVAVLGGETYLWNDNTGSWQPFTKSEADIEYSNDEMQKLMQEERDAKAQVKNDPVITPSWQTNTKEQLENRLLNTHKAIALNKANRYNLFASINTNETKRITDKDNLNISAKQKNKGSIVDPLTNLIAAIVMVGSKQGVGNLANVISARALLMFVNAHSNNTFKYSVGADAVKKEAIPIFLTPFGISKQDFQNLGDPNYSFGSLIDGDNRSVMFNSSEQITNEVDAVKNPVAIHLGYSQQNLNLIGYLTSLHITPEKIFTFLGERDSSGINFKSNNVTNKWALYVATNENMFHSGKTYTTEVEHEDYASGYNYTEYRKNQIELANNKLKQQFIADLLKEETNKFVRPDVSVTNYFEDIKNDEGRVVGTKLKYAEIERDGLTNQLLNNKVLKILYYWDLIEQAKQFMKSGKVIIADSHYSKSMNDALLQADSVEEQLNGKDISVISNSDLRGIIEGDQSIVSGFFSAQSKYKTYFLKYFFGHESIISRYLNDQLKLRYNKTSKEDLERLMNRAYSDLLVNILFKMQVIDPSISQGVFPKDSSGNTLTPEAMLHSKPASSNTKSTVYNIYRTLKQISGTTGKAQVLPKYSGITKSMATALLDILQFQLGVDGNRMASEDKVNKGEVVPADLVKLAEKVSNSATANNYIELFEEVKQLAPELFKEFTMISLYQAGFNNSPYNLFKAMPNTASTNDGIIDATAKATDAYSKFIKSVAKQLKQDSDLTQAELETDLHKEVVDEFLRWYDSQYGHFVAQDKNRAMFNDNTPIYRMYNSKAQKFDLYVIGARGFNETGTKIANRVAGAKNTVDFTKTVDKRYIPTAATVNDLASLGVLGEDAKVLIDNGIEVTKLCN